MRSFGAIALFALVAAAGYLALAYALQRSVLFPRLPHPGPSPAVGREGVEIAWLGPSGDVEAWFLPPRGTIAPAPALIFAHGNGELIDYWLEEFEIPRSWGLGVLLLEYPGYGRSGGRPSEESITDAATAAYDFLIARPDVDAGRIAGYGRSLGGGAVCALARERDVSALVLESAFTGVRDLARRYGLFGPLVRDPFDNLAAVREFEGPVLVIHGERDPMIPPSHGRALASAAAEGELILLDCGHNDCPRPWRVLHRFLADRGWLPPQPSGP